MADFRGAPASALGKLDGLVLSDADFSDADFSDLTIDSVWFTNCRFDRADLTNVAEQSSIFDACSFMKTDWRAGLIGKGHSRYTRCVFESPKLAKTTFVNARFQDCRLIGRWKSVEFDTSGFWDCVFEGHFEDITFRGDYTYEIQRQWYGEPRDAGLHDVSFADAELSAISVRQGCIVERVIMPRSGDAFLCDLQLLASNPAVLSEAAPDVRMAIKEHLDIALRVARAAGTPQRLIIVSRRDLSHSSAPPDAADKA